MTTQSIDRLNIGLMLGSCLLAFVIPFQLFLFSYAVLGPLHYFTEIPWLRGKGFFTTSKPDYILLIALVVAIGVLHFSSTPSDDPHAILTLIGCLGFVAFFGALALATIRSPWQKVIAVAAIAASALLFSKLDAFGMIFANLVPSIVHVYIFTGCFVLYGALRNRSAAGIASLGVFALCTIAIFAIAPEPTSQASLSPYVRNNYFFFAGLNFDLLNIFGMHKTAPDTQGLPQVLFESSVGIIVMRLIAFSYTYHFLNWFSKTSIIKWHLIPKRGLGIIALLWVTSLALYAYDFYIALQVLYMLSLLHVFLEFPLNQRTFIGIGYELGKLVRRPELDTAK